MSSFKDFLRWYNNTDVVPTLEAMQKMIVFYHDKIIEAWLYLTKPGQHLLKQIYSRKIQSIHGRG